MTQAFTWMPIYRELSQSLLGWESRQGELVKLLEEIRAEGYVVTPLLDQNEEGATFLLREIDPFTFLGAFNRGIREDQRRGILAEIKKRWSLASELPGDFAGIPILNNQRSWFISYQHQRKPDDVARLWNVFRLALAEKPLDNPQFLQAFDEALEVRGTNFNLTMGLFWARPDTFLNLDQTNRSYLEIKLPPDGLSAQFYRATIQTVMQRGKSLAELSYEAWQHETIDLVPAAPSVAKSYWLVGAVWENSDPSDQTERFLKEGVWENGYSDRYLDEVRAIRVGDRIAIKSTFTQRNNLPFDAHGHTVSCMRFKAVGTVVANRQDGRTVEVEWDRKFQQKDWYFTAHWKTIHKLDSEGQYDKRLIEFAFHGKPQDYSTFCQEWWGTPKVTPKGNTNKAFETPPYSLEDVIGAGVFLEESELKQTLDRLQAKKNLILQGPPGVGKTFLARRLAYALMKEKDDSRIEFVQFHQSYSYEDFVRGYRPMAEGTGAFGLQDGVFFSFCQRAREDVPERPYVFIVDEINRGNLSQIFGELLMLIEGDKRSAEHAVPLVYRKPGEARFFVPSNVHIIGLMNLADRSLALVDYALRRRFAFLTLKPQFTGDLFRNWLLERKMNPSLVDLIVTRLAALNQEISADSLLGENYQIGHSFFCPRGNDFAGLDRSWFEGIVETEIVPLLKEYWFDKPKRAEDCRKSLLAP